MKVGFTGTRKGMTEKQVAYLVDYIHANHKGWTEFHHGDCIGADAKAHELVVAKNYLNIGEHKVVLVIHPPIDSKYRAICGIDLLTSIDRRLPKPYLERNHNIVDETDILIAAPETLEEVLRSGTWATVRYARKKHKSVCILEP